MRCFKGIALAVAVVSTGSADVLVQWGERPTGSGTPGTDIVTANQNFISSVTTYSGITNNPAVGANYYPSSSGRSPHFSAAVSSTAYGGARVVEQAANGDRLTLYGQNVPAAATYRGMVMWASNHFLITDRAMTATNVAIAIQQRSNANTTDQGVSIVVKQDGSYFISSSVAFGANYLTQVVALASATWYAFTPFSSGTETIGSQVSAPSFNNVQEIGFYFTARNGGAAAGACGAQVSCFVVEGFETPAAGAQTLSVSVNQPAWGSVSPTGGTYATGQQVTLTATASNYYTFTGWSGNLGGATNPVTITMDDNRSIAATFAPIMATNNTPHWWLAQYGLSTSDAGALSDSDGDGLAAWQEYQLGSDPTTAPHITSIAASNRTAISLVFNEELSEANALALSHYALNSNLMIYAAAISGDRRTVTLTTTYLPTGQIFAVSLSGLATPYGAQVPATNVSFQCTPDLSPRIVNLIGDPGFDVPRSSSALSNAYWKAVNVTAGSSNGVELAGRQAWEAAQFSATYATYVAGDPDGAADTIRFNLDTFRAGNAGNSGTLIVQLRGVNGVAPTNDTQGTVLGSWPGTPRFNNESYTFSFDTDNDGAWHDETEQSFSVGADYDWYIIRLNVFPNSAASGEPEFTTTAMGADDVFCGIEGHTAPDTTPPHAVTELRAAPTPSSVTLSWRNATEDDADGVLILRRAGAAPSAVPVAGTVYAAGQTLGDGTVVAHAPGTNRAPFGYSSLVDSNISAGVSYYYQVYACDRVPNYSTAASTNVGPAVTFWWDANGASSGLGGRGNWDASSALWRSALSTDPLTTWPNTVPNTDEAIFDGTPGVITNVAGTINVHDLTFRANGFTITNGTLALSGADPVTITALGGVTSIIGSALSGTNLIYFPGPGAVILSAQNTASGAHVISGGTLRVDGQISGAVFAPRGTIGGKGAVNGDLSVSGGRVSPGSTVGQLSVGAATLSAGALAVDITNASGAAGTDWDLLTVGAGSGVLDLSGASSGSITVDVICASSALPGFDGLHDQSWKIVDAGSVVGFSAGDFVIRTNSFTPSMNEGTFGIHASGGDVYLDFTPATPVDLRISVAAAQNPADVGVQQTYTIVVSNAGPEAVGTYFVTNLMGNNVSYSSSSDGGSLSGNRVRWTLTGLAAQASRTLTLTTTNPLTQTIITNAATVSALRADPDSANNRDEAVVSIQCPGAPTPFLPVVANQTVETGNLLSFYVIASNADCSPPARLIAGGLPSGSTFSVSTNGYTVTGLFAWPFAGAPGTYPVRFSAANVTSQTNVMTVLLYVGAAGEPVNGAGVPLSQTNWSVAITNLTASAGGSLTLTWQATAGVGYDVYSTTGNYGDTGVSWTKLVAGAEATGSLETRTVTASGSQRYYQVVPEGLTPQHRGVWAIIKPTIQPGFNAFSPPLSGSDLRFNGAFGSNLASVLTGNNVYGLGDEAYILNADNSYSNVYLDASKVWRAAILNTPPATHELQPGQGVVILRRQGTSVQPEFRGPVGNQMVHTNRLTAGYNIVGFSEGRYLTIPSALSSIVSGSPAGSYNLAQADRILILESNGSYTTLQLLPDGSWLDLTTFSTTDRKFTPGKAYWYYRSPAAGDLRVRF